MKKILMTIFSFFGYTLISQAQIDEDKKREEEEKAKNMKKEEARKKAVNGLPTVSLKAIEEIDNLLLSGHGVVTIRCTYTYGRREDEFDRLFFAPIPSDLRGPEVADEILKNIADDFINQALIHYYDVSFENSITIYQKSNGVWKVGRRQLNDNEIIRVIEFLYKLVAEKQLKKVLVAKELVYKIKSTFGFGR